MTNVYNGTDATSPCFNFDAVVAAQLPLFQCASMSTPLLFCSSLPFYVESPLIATVGTGCNGKSACWASSQFLKGVEEEGPWLTELPDGRIVGVNSPTAAVYTFQRQEGSAAILLQVVQPGGVSGYVTISPTAVPDLTNTGSFYVTQVVTAAEALAAKAQWGVLGVPGSSNCLLLYTDATFPAALPLTQMFNWGNTLYFSSGSVSQGSTGTHAAVHGVTTIANPSLSANTLTYLSTDMTLLSNQLPAFTASDLDTGTLNVQWTLKALLLTQLAAHAYTDTYCSNAVCSGARAVLVTPSPSCVAVTAQFPQILKAKSVQLACKGPLPPAASREIRTRKAETLMIISAAELLVGVIVVAVLFTVQRKLS
jgi:hypothetical protein